MKKKISIWKVLFIILAFLLLICAGIVFLVYQKVNDISRYRDRFTYDYRSEEERDAEKDFERCIFYDKEKMVFEYKVPAYYMYDIINEESMGDFLGLPEELEIASIGIDPHFDEKKIDIYLSVKYRNLINTCLLVKTDLVLSEDQSRVELRYDDFFVIDEQVTDYVRKNVEMEKGTLMFTHRFPTHIKYYRMPDYRPEFVYDLDYQDGFILAKYDIASAMKDYLSTTEHQEASFDECMEKVYLEVRMNNIAHDHS